jgi:gamma-glutamyltranspeptidase/glutathione hydrolase
VHVAEILNILETQDLAALGEGSAEFIHVVSEAMKLAFADRAHWLGDADFTPVPRGLASKEYARSLAAKINHSHTTPVPQHGEPPAAQTDVFKKHTTHFSVADAAGWWVGCTATINYTYGSLVTVPGTGVILNDEMDDFAAQPGAPNAFGLVGAEANAVAPSKRPLSSMSPTIVLKDGQPILVIGAAGGPTIITQVLLGILRIIDFKQSPQAALAAPRFHQQWQPDELRVESTVPVEIRTQLVKMGHKLNVVPHIGVAQAVMKLDNGTFQSIADPRASGKGAGF